VKAGGPDPPAKEFGVDNEDPQEERSAREKVKRLFLRSMNSIGNRWRKHRSEAEGTKEGNLLVTGEKEERNTNPAEIRKIAENYYRQGDFYCSEAILKARKDAFRVSAPDTVIAMASGFPIGMGRSGCTCGAIVGGIMALGLFFGRTEAKDQKVNKAMNLSKGLHDWFRARHHHLCCRILTKDMRLGSSAHMRQCIAFTGEVAEETAKLIMRELKNHPNQDD
jgi:C_GCAxxG_C_C family probable redox protein